MTDIKDKLKKVGEDMGFEVLEGQKAMDFMEREMNKPENVKAREKNARENEAMLDRFFKQEHKYKWLKGMGEISGMGGSYEQGCRAMLIAGLEYWDANPSLDPKYRGFKDVYGILSNDNEDAKTLDKIVLGAVNNDCTGAMHQAVISTIFWIKESGWDTYVNMMRKKK